MPSTFTTNTGIEKIGNGEKEGLWGETTNLNFDIVDRALNGVGSITLSGTTHTLTTLDGALSDGQFAVLVFSGSPSGTNTVTIAPNTAEKLYWAKNSTAQNVILSQGSGSTVTLAPGESRAVATDGAGPTASVVDLTSSFATSTGTQTLTNKTISADNNTLSGLAASSFVLSNASGNIDGSAAQKAIPSGEVVGTTDTQTLTNKTVEKVILNDGYTEEVFAITDGTTVNLNPNNGSIQTWTLGANRTPGQTSWAAGQSITLLIDDGTSRTINWSTLGVVWKTNRGLPPVLETSGFTVVGLWKVGTTIYGARVGDA